MNSFGQLCQDVITKTGRPELVAEIQLAVRSATRYVHMKGSWMRDATERLFPYATVDYNYQINLDLLERYRKIRFVKKFDLSTMLPREGVENEIKEGSPTNLFDRYGDLKTNVFYLVGNAINIKFSTSEQGILISWYRYPDVNPESYQSWIADVYPDAIINKAAAQIFRDTGRTEDANRLDQWVEQADIPIIAQNDTEATAR